MRFLSPTRALGGASVALALTISTGAASAQVGGLIRRATGNAVNQQIENAGPPQDQPKFDNVTLELTEARLEKLLAGIRAGQKFEEGPNGLPALQGKLEAARTRAENLRSRSEKDIEKWNSANSTIMECRDQALGEYKQANQQKMQQRLMSQDQEYIRKVSARAEAVRIAMEKGDQATIARLQKEMEDEFGPTPEQVATVDRKCNKPLPAPPGVAQVVAADKEVTDLNKAIWDAQEKKAKAEQDESGMTDGQVHLAIERLRTFNPNKKRGFSQTEWDAISKHSEEIKRVVK